jgi:hypothetical protein
MSTATAVRAEALVTDLEIEQWVRQNYGFIPHPFWISHCKELFLHEREELRHPWHECPLDKRPVIRKAFEYFGLI